MFKNLYCQIFIIFFACLSYNNTLSAQQKQSLLVQNFVKTATGVFDNQKSLETQQIENLPNSKLRRQLALCYPIWEDCKDAHWMYFGWFSPQDKSNALEEMFIRILEDEKGNLIAQWYKLPPQAKKEDAQEWQKDKPFDNIIPEEIINSETDYLFAICDILTEGTGFVLKAREKGFFSNPKLVNYNAMLIDMSFYPESYTTGSKFFNADNEIILEHESKIPLLKISKKYKKF